MQECDSGLSRGTNASPTGSLMTRKLYHESLTTTVDNSDTSCGEFNNQQDIPKYSMLMNLNRQYKLQNHESDKMADIYATYNSPNRSGDSRSTMSPLGS